MKSPNGYGVFQISSRYPLAEYVKVNRRDFLTRAAVGAAALGADKSLVATGGQKMPNAYKYRIAFGAWINDMRTEPLPLENWPAPQFDDECVDSIIRTMDVQSQVGFQFLDVWGLFATYGWPVDIVSALDKDRRRRINRLIDAAKKRGMKIVLGLGTYSWGYDKIIEADPSVRGKGPSGEPHAHAMCDANPKSFEYVKRIIRRY